MRTCEICGNPLADNQKYYCGRTCQALGHPAARKINEAMPTDDEIWDYRHTRTYSDWARILGVSYPGFKKRALQRGWLRTFGSHRAGFEHAPCKCCGTPTPPAELSQERTCVACERPSKPSPVQLLVQHERARRIEPTGDRYEHWLRLPVRVIQSKHALPGIAA